MKTCCIKNWPCVALFFGVLLFASTSFAQLSAVGVDAGPYTPGSTIAATFSIGASACINQTNTFQLYLSDATGNFASETLIGSYTGFYSTYVNGIIPTGTPAGTGYQVRIKSTSPAQISSVSNPFEIKLGTAVEAKITSSQLNATNTETFGTCISKADNEIALTNASTATSTVSAKITDELGATSTTINFDTKNKQFTAQLSHYTIFTKAVMPDGTVATKAYLIVNNNVVTAFSSTGNNIVCLPMGTLEFEVTTSSGIMNNFPGDLYRVDWGDGTIETFTLCEILNNAGKIQHSYTTSSCGRTAGTILNAFPVRVNVNNAFCGDIGTPVSSSARVVVKPLNSFTFGTPGCTNTNIVFTNTSTAGQNPNTPTIGCQPNDVKYNWYVDGVLEEANQPRTFNLVYKFATNGPHVIRLTSNNPGACSADPFEQTICIQNPPQPNFTLPGTTFCIPSVVKATDISVVDLICNNTPTYTWQVTGPTFTYSNGTNANSKNPEFNFTNPGSYTISLSISTISCGAFVSAAQTVVVNALPTAVLSPDITLCNKATYDFNPTTTGPTKSTLTGTAVPTANTYLWTVTGGAYSFVNGTSAASQYPSIKFDDYVEYTVSVTHTNNCGTAPTAMQKLTFITSPVVDAGPDQTICFNGTSFSLNGVITGATTSNSWLGGAGTFSPDRNTLTATYTPTAAEKATGNVHLVLRGVTGLSGPCANVDDEVVLNIAPNITVTSAPTKIICTGSNVNYTPTSNPVGATYTWTATGSSNASGFTSTGTGNIIDVLSNSDVVADATVTYVITPHLNTCDGVPFNLVVTIKALSAGGATAGDVSVCSGANGGNITLSGQTGSIVRWESSIDNGATWSPIASTANPYVFTNLTVTTQFRAVVANSVCSEAISTITTIAVNPGTIAANAGPNQTLCGGNVATLSGNDPGSATGLWTLVSGQNGVTIDNPNSNVTQVIGLVTGQTYVFEWTIPGLAPCPPSSSQTTITYYLPLTNAISASATTVCSGQNAVITGDTPTGGNGTYTYQWQSSADGATFADIAGQTSKDLIIAVSTETYYRRTVNSNVCTSTSNSIQITTLPGLSNNTISADQNVCAGGTAATLTGSTPTGGSGTYTYQWQSSLDNGTTWTDVPAATAINYSPPAPSATILYRRSVSGGACSGNLSNTVKITVSPHAKAEIIYSVDKGCAPFILTPAIVKATPYPDRNNTYTWFADGVQIGTGINFPGYTIVNDNQNVVINLKVTSSLGCNDDEISHTFSTLQNVTATYTQNVTEGCGPLNVTFTNTSNSLTAASFKWDFGNGTTSNLAQPPTITYQPDLTGKDVTYTVTLEATTPCGVTTQTSTVLVKAKPISVFSPDKTTGCSPLAINFSNTSPGNSSTYVYDFGDGTTLTATDKNTVSHTYTTLVVRDYIVTMTATNECGTDVSQYTIRVSPNTITPELVVNSNQLRGCAALKVDFYNNTKGASTFVYDFGDGTTALTNTAPEVVSHTFTKPGTYIVTLYASNGCSNASTQETIVVLDQPTVAFSSDKIAGCEGTIVQFKNNSTNAIGYLWDFGDGTTSNDFEPSHTYAGIGNYTVSLTATNTLGCTNTSSIPGYINIVSPPVALFVVSPGNELSIPNFSFGFKDASTSAVSWEWNFGDGAVSTLQNPNHTYNAIGTYTVTLKILNKEGCSATTFQTVRIIGVPGYLNLPNSFMPASAKNELRVFKAKGRGIKEWHMMVFNKWGQMLWETTKLEDGAPLEGWDGTYNGQPQQQGVYYWRIEAKFINGGDWKGMTYDSSPPKLTGLIYLIR